MFMVPSRKVLIHTCVHVHRGGWYTGIQLKFYIKFIPTWYGISQNVDIYMCILHTLRKVE